MAEQKAIVAEYGHLFNSTGGNDIVELIEREGVNYFNNVVVAELQGCCLAQVILLQRLKRAGLLLNALLGHSSAEAASSPIDIARDIARGILSEYLCLPASTWPTYDSEREAVDAKAKACLSAGLEGGKSHDQG
jgi:hypothetical protein